MGERLHERFVESGEEIRGQPGGRRYCRVSGWNSCRHRGVGIGSQRQSDSSFRRAARGSRLRERKTWWLGGYIRADAAETEAQAESTGLQSSFLSRTTSPVE